MAAAVGLFSEGLGGSGQREHGPRFWMGVVVFLSIEGNEFG